MERRGNRQGENRGEKSILINERLFAFFLHLYYYLKEVRPCKVKSLVGKLSGLVGQWGGLVG